MAMTLEALLAPVSDDNPVGEDLSYDNERAQLEQAFVVEDSVGGGDAPEVDWRSVLRMIESQAKQTKDLWLAIYLARAGAGSGSLEMTELGLQALAGLFETYWANVHPQLEELGVPGRKAACDSLVNRRAFLGPLDRVALIAHPRLGRYNGADLERFRVGGSGAEGYGMFRAALDDLGPAGLQEAIGRVANMEDALRRADKAFTVGAAGEETTNFQPTFAALSQLAGALKSFAPEEAAEADAAEEEGALEGEGGGLGASARKERSVSGAINSREDVIKVLDLISTYYRQREPGHPMPMIIERTKAWVTMDYISLMKDIAPGGVTQAEGLLAPAKA